MAQSFSQSVRGRARCRTFFRGWLIAAVCAAQLYLLGCDKTVVIIGVGGAGDLAKSCENGEMSTFLIPDARFEPEFAGCPDTLGPCEHPLASKVWLATGEKIRGNWSRIDATLYRCNESDGFDVYQQCNICKRGDCELPEGVMWPLVLIESSDGERRTEGGVSLVRAGRERNDAERLARWDVFGPCFYGTIPEFTPSDGGYYLFNPLNRFIKNLPKLDASTALDALEVTVVQGMQIFTPERGLTPLGCRNPDQPNIVRYYWQAEGSDVRWDINFSDKLRVGAVRVKIQNENTYLTPYRIVAHHHSGVEDFEQCSCNENSSCLDNTRCWSKPTPPPSEDDLDDGNIDFISSCFEADGTISNGHILTPVYKADVPKDRLLWIVEFKDALYRCIGGSDNGKFCASANECPDGTCQAQYECVGGNDNGKLCTSGTECLDGTCELRFAPPDPGRSLEIEFTIVTTQ